MTDQFAAAITTLNEAHEDELANAVDGYMASIFAAGLTPAADEADFVGLRIPPETLQGSPTSVLELVATIDALAPRWQLDALCAIDDYLI